MDPGEVGKISVSMKKNIYVSNSSGICLSILSSHTRKRASQRRAFNKGGPYPHQYCQNKCLLQRPRFVIPEGVQGTDKFTIPHRVLFKEEYENMTREIVKSFIETSKPPRNGVPKAGFFYILLTIFLGVAAVNTANNLIYLVVSALLGFMGISGFFRRQPKN